MKKSKITSASSLADTNIDQYCRSVEDLLKNINAKPCTKARKETFEEDRFLYYDENMFEYE
jgi:hypothetical protein